MSDEVIKQQKNFGANVASYAAFPAFQTAISATSAVKRNGGIKKAIAAQNRDAYKALNNAMKNQGVDMFTRSQALALGYENYKDLVTQTAKAGKKVNKINKVTTKGKLPLFDKISNLFRKNKITTSNYGNVKKLAEKQNVLKQATDTLQDANQAIKKAGTKLDINTGKILDKNLKLDGIYENVANGMKVGTKATFKSTAKGLGQYAKQNFKNELGLKHGKLNYLMTALQFFPNVINEVIPAFKEGGFKAGMKETGKTLARAGADLVGYALGGSIGRAIGAAIGTIICPGVGSKVGAMVGDGIFTMLIGSKITKTVDKMVGVKDETQEVATENNESNIQKTENKELAQNDLKENKTSMEENQIATTNPIQEQPKSAYKRPQNGVYQTAWVNDLNKQKQLDLQA